MGLTGKIIHNGKKVFVMPGDVRKVKGKKLTNNSDSARFFFYASPLFTRNKPLSIYVEVKSVSGENCTISLADRGFSLGQVVNPNQLTTLSESKKIQFIVFVVPANSELLIESVQIEVLEADNNLLTREATGDYLVITSSYPSDQNPYDPSRLSDRVQSYLAEGLEVDVVEIGHAYTSKTVSRTHRNVRVLATSFNNLRTLLQKKTYKKIILTSFSPQIIQIIDATDISRTQLIFIADNEMLLYPEYDALYRPYFTRKITPDEQARQLIESRNEAIEKYSTHKSTAWIFPSNFLKKHAEVLHDTTFNNAVVIHPSIKTDLFAYTERPSGKPVRICLVRTFDNHNRFGVDIDVRTILNLSKKPYFKDLVISVYGTGPADDYIALTEPLRQFSNVSLYKYSPTQEELAVIYQQHDILLAADRFNANTLNTYEASLTGIVPVVSSSEELAELVGDITTLSASTENTAARIAIVDHLITNEVEREKIGRSLSKVIAASQGKKAADIALLKTKFIEQSFSFKPAAKNPILTVTIPSYNVEPFLRNCVFSLVNHPQAHKLEILIVSDGSKDATVRLGQELQKLTETKNGPIVRLIDKENGGHGSTINVGIREARGKYFRLLDGDDYFITKNFERFIEILENETSDIVLTDLIEDYAISATKIFKNYYASIQPGQQNDLDVMNFAGYGFGEWGPLLSTTTCKTQLLKDANFAIDEHCFYVDMEYNFIIYSMAKNITYYPLTIYNYYLGRVGQSMSKESMMRNVLHHEKVTLRLIAELNARRDTISKQKQAYIINKLIIPLAKTQYYITTEYFNDKKYFLSFDKKLKKYPEFYNNREIAGNIIKLHRLSGGALVFSDATLKKAKQIIRR